MTEGREAIAHVAAQIDAKLRELQPDSNFGSWRCDAGMENGAPVVRVSHFLGRELRDIPDGPGRPPVSRFPASRCWVIGLPAAVVYLGWLNGGNAGTPNDCSSILAGGTWGPFPAVLGAFTCA